LLGFGAAADRAELISLNRHYFSRISIVRPSMIGGRSPKYEWRPNAGGKRRTIEEACDIARRWGVVVPDYVSFAIDKYGWLDENITARTTTFKEPAGTLIHWSSLFHRLTGKIPFLIRRDILDSDEAIVAVVGHEMFELERMRMAFAKNGAPIERWLAEAHPDNEGNFHWQAWDYADQLVARMRGDA
jgi:hypothetical protein